MAERIGVNVASQPNEKAALNNKIPTIEEMRAQLEELDRRISALEAARNAQNTPR